MDAHEERSFPHGKSEQGLAPPRHLITIYDRDPNHPYNKGCHPLNEVAQEAQAQGSNSQSPAMPTSTPANPPVPLSPPADSLLSTDAPTLSAVPVPANVQLPYMRPWHCLSLGDIEKAGVSEAQARHLNTVHTEYGLQVLRQRLMYQNTLDFLAAKQALQNSYAGKTLAVDANGVPLTAPSQIDFRAFIPDFIACRWLCKTRSTTERTGWRYLIYDIESRRHIAIDAKDLRVEFETFLYQRLGDGDMPTMRFQEQLFELLLRAISVVEKSGLRVLSASEIPFANGIYDILTDHFTPFTQNDAYFAMFAMMFDFDPNAPNPDAFDALLADSFQGDAALIQLAYEIIGALIAPGQTLKKIYVFQGVSGGGKTRLAEIIMALLDEFDIYVFNTVADLVKDDLVKDARDCRLVWIKEATKNKLVGKQISYMKSFADGGNSRYAAAFKMLLCSNYKLLTGDNDFLEPALQNRFAVLPFPYKMKNTAVCVKKFEKKYFIHEKSGIALKALRAFGNVLKNEGRFSSEYPVNDIVEVSEASPVLTEGEQQRIGETLTTPQANGTKAKCANIINQTFEITSDINYELPAEHVFEVLNQISPGIVADTASLGKLLRKLFGDKLLSDRNKDGKVCYNLRLRTPADSAEVSA